MKHAREDYNKTMKNIPKDEPVFLIRAQDVCSGDTVRYWASLARNAGASAEIVKRAQDHAAAMDAWAVKKTPDLPGVPNQID